MTNADHQDGAALLPDPLGAADPVALTAPTFPSPHSVKGRVLGALLRGDRLTHLDCWRRFGSARLSHHIYVLRGIGWSVEMIEETVTTSDAGRAATIGIYLLRAEAISQAGEEGQRYATECARIEAERKAA